jgi:hypothetical protein
MFYYVIGLYLVKIILFLISYGCSPLLPIRWTNLQIQCRHDLPLTNHMLLWINKTAAASHSAFIIRQLYNTCY